VNGKYILYRLERIQLVMFGARWFFQYVDNSVADMYNEAQNIKQYFVYGSVQYVLYKS
jgi:hypothetical protein